MWVKDMKLGCKCPPVCSLPDVLRRLSDWSSTYASQSLPISNGEGSSIPRLAIEGGRFQESSSIYSLQGADWRGIAVTDGCSKGIMRGMLEVGQLEETFKMSISQQLAIDVCQIVPKPLSASHFLNE